MHFKNFILLSLYIIRTIMHSQYFLAKGRDMDDVAL